MREGAEAIYKEGPFVAHVRLHNIRASKNKMEADVTLLKVLGTRTPETPVPEQWKIMTSSIGGFQEAWSAAYVGWEIFFDAKLIAAVLEYANALPENIKGNDRRKQIRAFIIEFNDVASAAAFEVWQSEQLNKSGDSSSEVSEKPLELR